MTVSARSYLTAGVAAMVVGAIAIAPVQPSAPASITADTVQLSAAVQPLVNEVAAAASVLGQTAPATAPQQPQAQASVTANNNVSNAIDAAYSVIMYWADYFALDLGPYLLGWIPFGYLISDQIYIWYPNFTVPVADSFVYDFLDPVVNDFWNPTVWRDGLTAIANSVRVGLGTVVNQEIAYVWSLQWFPFPLPPLPPLPFAATKVAAPAAASTDDAASAKTTVTSGTGHSARVQVAKQSADTPTTATVTDTTTQDTAAAKTSQSAKTTTSGKSGSATSAGDTGKKRSTAGSARSHGPKAEKAANGDSG